MDKNTFLEKLFRMYPVIFNEFNIPDWYDAYSDVLSVSGIDYDHLFRVMLLNWDDMRTAPSPKWFRQNHTASIKQDDRCEALKHIEEIKKDCVPPPPELKAKMAALKEKMEMR